MLCKYWKTLVWTSNFSPALKVHCAILHGVTSLTFEEKKNKSGQAGPSPLRVCNRHEHTSRSKSDLCYDNVAKMTELIPTVSKFAIIPAGALNPAPSPTILSVIGWNVVCCVLVHSLSPQCFLNAYSAHVVSREQAFSQCIQEAGGWTRDANGDRLVHL